MWWRDHDSKTLTWCHDGASLRPSVEFADFPTSHSNRAHGRWMKVPRMHTPSRYVNRSRRLCPVVIYLGSESCTESFSIGWPCVLDGGPMLALTPAYRTRIGNPLDLEVVGHSSSQNLDSSPFPCHGQFSANFRLQSNRGTSANSLSICVGRLARLRQ